jgi:Xylose isomerase-like TIM barrel
MPSTVAPATPAYSPSTLLASTRLGGQRQRPLVDDGADAGEQLVTGGRDGAADGHPGRVVEVHQGGHHLADQAAALGVRTVVGLTGSKIWTTVAMFPPVPESMIADGYRDFADRWNPILDVFDEVGVRFAHEVHPSEIAYDYWTTVAALDAVGRRPAFGLNWDPSHFIWQDLDPVGFLWDFRDRIYHVDCKDVKRQTGNGRNGRLGSHLPWADPRRGWDFRVHRARRHAVGGVVPDAQRDRPRRAGLGGVGGRRDGSAGRRAGGPRVRPPPRL